MRLFSEVIAAGLCMQRLQTFLHNDLVQVMEDYWNLKLKTAPLYAVYFIC